MTFSHRDGFVPFSAVDAAAYQEAGYWHGRSLGELLRAAARRWGARPALLDDAGERLSYAELDAAADRMAAGLRELGIATGDRIIVQLPNIPEFVVVLFGLLRARALPVLCLPAHRSAEITHLAKLSGAIGYVIADRSGGFDYRTLADSLTDAVDSVRHVLVHGDAGRHTELAAVWREPVGTLPEPDPADIALLLVSGGTTGLPKLIARTHDDYAYNARASTELCELTEDDVYLAVLPAAHNFPLACPGILGTISTGGAIALISDPSPENVFAAIEQHRVTVTAVVPSLAQLWCAATEWEDAELGSLRLLQVGGARLAEANARDVRPKLGTTAQQVFGMAEGLLNYTPTRRLGRSDRTHPRQAAVARRPDPGGRRRRQRCPARRRRVSY